MEPIVIEEDGFVDVTLKGVTKAVDVYDAWNRLNAIAEESQGKPVGEYHGRVVELIASLGFPAVSHRAADVFAGAMLERVGSFKKNSGDPAGSTTPESAASTV